MNKKIILGLILLFIFSSFNTNAIGNFGNPKSVKLYSTSTMDTSLYEGHLRIYIVEPISRWNNYDN